jgi:hypothetical protein
MASLLYLELNFGKSFSLPPTRYRSTVTVNQLQGKVNGKMEPLLFRTDFLKQLDAKAPDREWFRQKTRCLQASLLLFHALESHVPPTLFCCLLTGTGCLLTTRSADFPIGIFLYRNTEIQG